MNLQGSVKRSFLERETPSTLSEGSNFCSCNPGRRRRPCLNTRWPYLPRDTQSFWAAWRGGTNLNPAGSHPSSSCCAKPLSSLCNQKASSWRATYFQARAASWGLFGKAPCRLDMRGGKPPSLPSILGVKAQRSCSHVPWQPQMQSRSCEEKWALLPHAIPAASRGITGIQIVVFGLHPSNSCQHVALQLHSSQGLSSLFYSGLERKKKQADEFRAVSISLLWEFVVSDMWREITLDNKGYDIFSLLFRTERCAWVRGCNRESKRVSACVGLYVIAILSCFSFKFPYAFPSF